MTTTVDSQPLPRQGLVKPALAVLVFALLLVPALAAQAAPGDTVLVSQADGAGANGESGPNVAVSAGGRFVAFESSADNLSSEDDDAVQNVFVRNTETGVTSLVSRATGATGAGADGDSANPSISPDGRYVAFQSSATNLSDVDADAVEDVFLRDTEANTTKLMSRATGTGPGAAGGDGDSRNPAVTSNPVAVAFDSEADNLSDEDGDGIRDVFVRRTSAAITVLVSRVGGGGAAADADSYDPSLDANGQRVAFTSEADNLSAAAAPSVANVFVYDTVTRFVSLASRNSATPSAGADADSFEPSISPDGRCVSFTSYGSNLTPDPPTPAFTQVFVRDIQANTITLASRASGAAGAVADGSSSNSSVDLPPESDATLPCEQRSIAFLSAAENLSGEDSATFDVFVRDMYWNLTALASRANGELGAGAGGSSFGSAMSPEGAFVAFASEADNLSTQDDDRFRNVYLRALITGPPPPPPPPPDLGDNDHSHHGADMDHTDHEAAGHADHSAAGHAGHAAGSVLSGSIIFADGKQRVGKLFVMATLHEPGKIRVKATISMRGGRTARVYRFKRISKQIPIHTLTKIRLRLSASKLRAVRRALHRGHRLRARVTGTAQYSSGKQARTKRKIKLRP